MANILRQYPKLELYGEEQNEFLYNVARLRITALGGDPSGIVLNNFMETPFYNASYGNNQKFDFIFSNLFNFPLDWSLGKFFDLVSSYMKPNSKAIFVRNSKLFNSPSGLEFRKKIVVS